MLINDQINKKFIYINAPWILVKTETEFREKPYLNMFIVK